jgi:uncharacterized membrane protein
MNTKRNSLIHLLFCIVIFSLVQQGQSAHAAQSGKIIGWGSQVVGVDLSKGFVKVAAGGSHSLGLKGDGSIVAWGSNTDHKN